MIEFLKHGKVLNGVPMGMTLSNLYSILGKPENSSGEKNYGYVHYGSYRYGFTDDIVNEMAIEFKLLENPIQFNNLEYRKQEISIFENFVIQRTTKIHTIISLINHLQLHWKAANGIDKDALIIKIENGPYIFCDLFDGTVDKITIVDE